MKLMIISVVVLAILIAGAILFFSGCRKDNPISGGRTNYTGEGYSKTIESTEICEMKWDFGIRNTDDPYENVILSIKVLDDGSCDCEISGYDEYDEFKATFKGDEKLLAGIDQAIKKYKLPEKNGTGGKTAGLPPQLGETISVKYKSDEKLYISDNSKLVTSDEFKTDVMKLLEEAALRAGTELCKPIGVSYSQNASYAQGCYSVSVKRAVRSNDIELSADFIDEDGKNIVYQESFTAPEIWDEIVNYDVLKAKPKTDTDNNSDDLFATDETTCTLNVYYPCGTFAEGKSVPDGFAEYMLSIAKEYKY